MGLLNSMVQLATRVSEAGILSEDSSLRSIQPAIDLFAGQVPPKPSVRPPVNDPPTLDEATADISNQLFRIVTTTPMFELSASNLLRAASHAVKTSFSGLGRCDRVDALHILWPNGSRQRLENLPINNTIRIMEGKPGYAEVYAPKSSIHARMALYA
jgi:hypothetical protein